MDAKNQKMLDEFEKTIQGIMAFSRAIEKLTDDLKKNGALPKGTTIEDYLEDDTDNQNLDKEETGDT